MVNAEGFLLSHTSEVLDVPAQEDVDAFLPEFRPPADWVLDPERPRTFSALPEPRVYAEFQRNVAEAMDGARGLIEAVAAEFTARFGREKTGLLELTGNPEAETALVTMGTIGDSAQELLDGDDDLLLVRVHAYRPFPAAALQAALARASYVSVIDRAAAFGSLGALGADVRSLDLGQVRSATNFVCGVGGTEVTLDTLRWALEHTRSGDARDPGLAPVHVPEGV
jgi:pyruvate ferredoxin oxidoreductase alpha subunit